MYHPLVTLVGNMVEGISFVLFMLDDKLGNIILNPPDSPKEDTKKVTRVSLLTSDSGAGLPRSWSPQLSIEILPIG